MGGCAGRAFGNVLVGVALGLVLMPLAGLLSGGDAQAFVPPVDRVMREIARVNSSSGRNQALQLDVTMRIGDRPPIAKGELITHPSGLARLELRGYNGRIDRYLLSGRELLGAKNGLALDRPQPMLQPLFFMQTSSEATLRAALESFEVLTESIGLAPCGDQDCFVIGDPRLAAPLLEPAAESNLPGGDALGDPLADQIAEAPAVYEEARIAGEDGASLSQAGLGSLLKGPELMLGDGALLPRIWVDTTDLQIRRIDQEGGVFTIFGPIVSFERLMIPAWFEVHEPGADPIRFEIGRAVQVNAPPQAFSREWLLAPIDPVLEGGAGAPPGTTSAPANPVPSSR